MSALSSGSRADAVTSVCFTGKRSKAAGPRRQERRVGRSHRLFLFEKSNIIVLAILSAHKCVKHKRQKISERGGHIIKTIFFSHPMQNESHKLRHFSTSKSHVGKIQNKSFYSVFSDTTLMSNFIILLSTNLDAHMTCHFCRYCRSTSGLLQVQSERFLLHLFQTSGWHFVWCC